MNIFRAKDELFRFAILLYIRTFPKDLRILYQDCVFLYQTSSPLIPPGITIVVLMTAKCQPTQESHYESTKCGGCSEIAERVGVCYRELLFGGQCTLELYS